MRCELVHTSLPRGLDGGSGFVVAGRTGGMPRTLSDIIADLSGLNEAWPGAADWDRTLRATRAIEWRDEVAWVASVIRPCGLDHTGRGNRIAHHRLLDADEMHRCDPVSLLLDHERWMAVWKGEPREMDADVPLPSMPGSSGPALAWQAAFGDAGMAAEMLEHAYRSGVGAWIVVPHGADRLRMLHELAGLLPLENRWKRGWSTRPIRPAAHPAPVIAVVDEREPLVCGAPANAAWVLLPRVGETPRAGESLLRRAREGEHGESRRPQATSSATLQWQTPVRLAAPGAAGRESGDDASVAPQSAAADSSQGVSDAPIRVEMAPVRRGAGMWWLIAGLLALLGAVVAIWRPWA